MYQVDPDLARLALEKLGEIRNGDAGEAAFQEGLEREAGTAVVHRDHDLGDLVPAAVLKEGAA